MAVRLPNPDSNRQTCGYCEAHVTQKFRRVYGTDDGHAIRCPECDSWARIMRGSACGREVTERLDPQEYPSRKGGVELRKRRVTDGGENA